MMDLEIAAKMARELAAKNEPMGLVLAPETVFQLTACLQLALRHPGLPSSAAAAAIRFVSSAGQYLHDCPTVLDIIQKGHNTDYDSTPQKSPH